MNPRNTDGQEDRALDALILLAFLEGPPGKAPAASGPEPELDPADQRALDALGPDWVRKLLEEDLAKE